MRPTPTFLSRSHTSVTPTRRQSLPQSPRRRIMSKTTDPENPRILALFDVDGTVSG